MLCAKNSGATLDKFGVLSTLCAVEEKGTIIFIQTVGRGFSGSHRQISSTCCPLSEICLLEVEPLPGNNLHDIYLENPKGHH